MVALFSRQSSALHPRRVKSRFYFAAGAWLRLIYPRLRAFSRLSFARCPVIRRGACLASAETSPS